jgi:hypothetical protein
MVCACVGLFVARAIGLRKSTHSPHNLRLPTLTETP